MVVEVLIGRRFYAVGKEPSCQPMADEETGPGTGAAEIAGAVHVDRWVWAP
jgi:hypothetical protein